MGSERRRAPPWVRHISLSLFFHPLPTLISPLESLGGTSSALQGLAVLREPLALLLVPSLYLLQG